MIREGLKREPQGVRRSQSKARNLDETTSLELGASEETAGPGSCRKVELAVDILISSSQPISPFEKNL